MEIDNVQMIYLSMNTEKRRAVRVPPRNSQDEAQSQANLMKKVIRYGYDERANLGIADNPRTLKIFMAPEFYFRHPDGLTNGDNHFTRDDFTLIVDELATLGPSTSTQPGLVNQPWLVVPGTIVWTPPPAPPSTMRAIMNSMPILDFTGNATRRTLCDKRFFAGDDKLDGWLNGAGGGIPRPITAAYDPSQTHVTCGMRIGMEICLDHSERVLRNHLDNLKVNRAQGAPPPPENALQLLIACGMDFLEANCAVPDTGLVLRCNGSPYNSLDATALTTDPADQRYRSDVYGKGLNRPHWRRDPDVQLNMQNLPPPCQRAWKDTSTGLDMIGVSPVYAVSKDHRHWV